MQGLCVEDILYAIPDPAINLMQLPFGACLGVTVLSQNAQWAVRFVNNGLHEQHRGKRTQNHSHAGDDFLPLPDPS
jgi:hypothetical protein